MLFNSAKFLVFFPIVLIVYYIIPQRFRTYWLLVCSYYFYMSWNPEYAVLIAISTIITWVSGLLIEMSETAKSDEKGILFRKKVVVGFSFVMNLSILFFFKYFNFTVDFIEAITNRFGITMHFPTLDVILPVGISFYTFQALSYTMDVYRGDIYAEKNIFKYALFVSFFPQLVAGPIERSKNLLKQLPGNNKFDFDLAVNGFLLMLWGYFLKIVMADRIAIFVDAVYGDYKTYGGTYLWIGTFLFAIQIYCDFAGYSTIAMGASQFLGIRLMENFNAPYLSTTVAEFWRNWHISLTSWFKDYLYIPLGGSRKGKCRKYLNKMIVFLVSGLWHGANLSYVVWGGLNGLFQVVGEILLPIRKKITSFLGMDRESSGFKLIQMFITFIFVDFTWIFFRASSVKEGLAIIKSMATVKNPWVFWNGEIYTCGLDSKNFGLMVICIGILLIADILKRRGISVKDKLLNQDVWFQGMAISLIICFILVFGIWGPGYNEANFIYFQF